MYGSDQGNASLWSNKNVTGFPQDSSPLDLSFKFHMSTVEGIMVKEKQDVPERKAFSILSHRGSWTHDSALFLSEILGRVSGTK